MGTLDKGLKREWLRLTAENARLRVALKIARARIEYLGAVASDEKHFLSNQEEYLPRIDAALNWVPDSNGDR